MNHSFEICHATKDAWENFQISSKAVQQCLADDEGNGYQGECLGRYPSPHRAASFFYADWEREMGDDARVINHCAGIIVISPLTLLAINELNTAKQTLKNALDALKKNPDLFENTMQALHLTRLHYWKISRQIHGWEDVPPSKMTLSLEQKVRIESVTRDECLKKLEEMGSNEHIQWQYDLCSRLPETFPLAYVYPSKSIRICCNVIWLNEHGKPDHSMKARGFKLKKRSGMPFFVVSSDPTYMPAVKLPKSLLLSEKDERLQRNDVELSPTPYLPSLRVHTYIDQPAN